MQQLYRIENKFGEELDTVVEGNENTDISIVFIHGFGTQKNETEGLFIDISKALGEKYRIVRFDFSGYGKSQGKQEDVNFKKQASDLETILQWVIDTYHGKIYIVAQSLGCFVTAVLSPDFVEKIVFTSVPNSNADIVIERLKKYFESKPGIKINEKEMSFIPRSTGERQKIGPRFWEIFRTFNPVEEITHLANKSKLLVIKPLQDQVVGNEFFEEYKTIPHLAYVEINGDHSFRKKDDRKILIEKIKEFFKK